MSEAWVENFVRSYRVLVALTRDAVQHAVATDPSDGRIRGWRDTALPNLESNLNQIEAALEKYRAGEIVELLRSADEALHLAKNLDWCGPADFAGPEFEKKLDEAVTAVVIAASWLRSNG